MGGKAQRSYRLDADTVAAVEAWAAEHGTTNTEAVETLLRAAMDGAQANLEGAPVDQANGTQIVDALRANIDDLRAQVSTLTAQLASKDDQLAEQAAQIRGLMDITDHAQRLHAAAVAGQLEAPAHDARTVGEQSREDGEAAGADERPQDTPQPAESVQTAQERPTGLWARIKAALMGY